RRAEQNLLAAQARISEAKAALFPDLSLTGNYGSESRRLADLFSGPATIWGLTAGLVQTVFNAGRTEAGIQAADARQTQALVGYEQAVQQAFREVLDALVAHRQARELGTADQRRASALARTLELADLRYRNGVDNYLQVLDAQRNLYQAQQSAIDARRAQLAASADLIKALGGGWNGAVADDPTGALALQRAPGLAMPMAK
ncbi:MAG: TolC family protein, partial [Thiobacillaceae bacterium]